MSEEQKPASETDVENEIADILRYHPEPGEYPQTVAALIAEKLCALGCLLPEEAAKLRDAIKLRDQWREEDGARWVEIATERDTLTARLKVAEDALRFYGGHDPDNSDMGDWLEKMNDDFGETARAALTPPPSAEDAP